VLAEFGGHGVGNCGDVLVKFRVCRARQPGQPCLANQSRDVRNQVAEIMLGVARA
jgi:hypothetical protein